MIIGLAWITLASFFLGTFAFPGKFVKNYEWENTWGAFFFFAMWLVPLAFGFGALNGLTGSYQQVPAGVLLGVVGLGFLWGTGFCLWGIGLSRIGLSLGYAITMGTMALVGSMLPFFLGSADKMYTTGGQVIIIGILICIVGVVINGIAGIKREKHENAGAVKSLEKKDMFTGVVICFLAGLFSSCCNIAFHIGANIGKINIISVEQYGNPVWLSGISIWVLIFIGGGISSVSYSAYLLLKNHTWKNFAVPEITRNLTLALIMALGHFGCLFFYGVGGWKLGALGTSVGFAIFQTGSILLANLLGFLTGEWIDAGPDAKRWMYAGLSVLILGIIVVSIGNMI
jgi:L-rhamnose-H+ transport protein